MAKPEITPELQEYIDEVVAGLKDKNAELIGEVRKLKVGKAIDPADVAKLEDEIELLRSDNAKITKESKQLQKTLEDSNAALKQESDFTQSLLIENGLATELSKAGIPPQFLKAAQAMLRSGASVVSDGDRRVARIGEKDLAAAVKDWASSDEGKHFVTADGNSGGGAGGGGGRGGDSLKMSRSAFDALSPGQKSEFGKKGGTLTSE